MQARRKHEGRKHYQTMYRNMVLARELDRRMLALQRQGRIVWNPAPVLKNL